MARLLQRRGRRRLRQTHPRRDPGLSGERQGARRRRPVGGDAPGAARGGASRAAGGRVSRHRRRQDRREDRRAGEAAHRPREARVRVERRPGPGRALRAPHGRNGDPQNRLQGDEARRVLRRLGSGRRGRSSIRGSRRARPRPRRSAASPSSIRPRRAPCSTGSRSRSPIRSRRSLAKPPSPRRP